MQKYFLILYCVMSAALLFGCAQQSTQPAHSPAGPQDLFVLIPDQDGKIGQITISNDAGSTTLSRANESALVTSHHIPTRTKILSRKDIQKDFHDTLQAVPGTADQFILFFSSGTTQLTKESQEQLPQILKRIKERFPCEIAIIGHSDTEASREYNLTLSLKRAIHVKDQLLSIGAPRKHLEVSSHGENDPLVPTADNVAEPKNRRVEIFIR
ncbi:MAG: OmpA family protein [Candidatus Electrothrix sp. AUS4]|nr:OmpA family protein [Candidatus Electrothrix sp. AUS4]